MLRDSRASKAKETRQGRPRGRMVVRIPVLEVLEYGFDTVQGDLSLLVHAPFHSKSEENQATFLAVFAVHPTGRYLFSIRCVSSPV